MKMEHHKDKSPPAEPKVSLAKRGSVCTGGVARALPQPHASCLPEAERSPGSPDREGRRMFHKLYLCVKKHAHAMAMQVLPQEMS